MEISTELWVKIQEVFELLVEEGLAEKPKSNGRTRKKFIAPTEEEVRQYAMEKGLPLSMVRGFWLYYDNLQWHDMYGKQISNWKGKFISWCNRNRNETQTNGNGNNPYANKVVL